MRWEGGGGRMRWGGGGGVWVCLGKWPLLTLPEKVQLMGKNKIKGKNVNKILFYLCITYSVRSIEKILTMESTELQICKIHQRNNIKVWYLTSFSCSFINCYS
jgi:hypothetical protein